MCCNSYYGGVSTSICRAINRAALNRAAYRGGNTTVIVYMARGRLCFYMKSIIHDKNFEFHD